MTTSSLLIGTAFALAGLLLLTTQVLVVDLTRAYGNVRAAIIATFGHDTDVFPDHTHEELPRNS